eukprot:gene2426-3274_t
MRKSSSTTSHACSFSSPPADTHPGYCAATTTQPSALTRQSHSTKPATAHTRAPHPTNNGRMQSNAMPRLPPRRHLATRRASIYDPYHAAIAELLNDRAARGQKTLLVSLHSFTPVMQGFVRPWRYGVLHRGDSPLSDRMLMLLQAALGDEAGDNEPYAMDGRDNTIPLHADARGLDYLELEIRQDLIAEAAGQAEVATFVARLLEQSQA